MRSNVLSLIKKLTYAASASSRARWEGVAGGAHVPAAPLWMFCSGQAYLVDGEVIHLVTQTLQSAQSVCVCVSV